MSLKSWFKSPGSPDSHAYWEERYRKGGTSGSGSAGRLAQFKAGFLNDFVAQHQTASIIEFGCGDGGQLALARYPAYTGVDVSEAAVAHCRKRHGARPGFRFFLAHDRPRYSGRYDLALSLDVIFHLVEDAVYGRYMGDLFAAAERFVVIYSSNFESVADSRHVRHRKFTGWIANNAPGWTLTQHTPNPYPHDPARPDETSHSDFHVFAKRAD